MINLSKEILSKITNDQAEIDYVNSRVFDLKRHLKKTQKRTGLNRFEISLIVSKEMKRPKPSEGYLDKLLSLGRFKSKGDIYSFQHEKIVQIMACIV